MFRLTLRLIGWLALAGGFVVLVINGTQTIAANHLVLTSFGALTQRLLGPRYDALDAALQARHLQFLWHPVLTSIFAVPAFAILMVAGALVVLVTERRKQLIGHSSRP
ncbi:MAG: hypothetical protein KGQ37_10530 [Hyphomicrobiales bacterium]|nr:hypothetical protein [Hyphomicrobiales bacterium]